MDDRYIALMLDALSQGIRQNSQAVMVSASAERSQTVPSNLFQATCCYQPVEWHFPAPMKRLLLVHNLVHGQSVVHELDERFCC